jgi:hypothetical protein
MFGVFVWLFTAFSSSQRWEQRPLDMRGGDYASKLRYVRHDHSFYQDGTNSGFFEDGVHADAQKNLGRYTLPPQPGDMSRHDGLMKQAERDVADEFRPGSYRRIMHNCHHYRRAVNERYTELVRRNGGIPIQVY